MNLKVVLSVVFLFLLCIGCEKEDTILTDSNGEDDNDKTDLTTGFISGTAIIEGASNHSSISISIIPNNAIYNAIQLNPSEDGSFTVDEVPLVKFKVLGIRSGFKSDSVENVIITAGDTSLIFLNLNNIDPTAVKLLNPANVSDSSLTLKWEENLDADFSSYNIYRAGSPGVDTSSLLLNLISSQSITQFHDTNLEKNTPYYYKIYVEDIGNFVNGSNEIEIFTNPFRIGNTVGPIQLFTGGTNVASYPTWSPDGAELAFLANHDGQLELWIYDISSGTSTRLSDSNEDIRAINLSWSPLGTYFAYRLDLENGEFNLWKYEISSKQKSRITMGSYTDNYPTWSPDESELFFVSNRSSPISIWSVSSSGNSPIQFISNEGENTTPSVSHDGKMLVVSSKREGSQFELWLHDLSSSATRKLTTIKDDGDHFDPSWSPMDDFVLYINNTGLKMVRISDNKVWYLIKSSDIIRLPQWSPDGSKIAYEKNQQIYITDIE